MKYSWSVIEESTHWLVINKPSSLNVEPIWDYPNVEAQVRAYLKANGRRAEPYVGVVHRLDRPVSGVLVMAKKKSALRFLNQQFAERQVEKNYWAICEGQPPAEAAVLEHYLVKDQQQKRSFVYPQRRKDAAAVRLSYRVLKSDGARSWLEVKPHTGKFHQIRVQLAAIGCPIIGDQKYGSTVNDETDCIALHARSLAFNRPEEPSQRVIVEADLPARSVWEAAWLSL